MTSTAPSRSEGTTSVRSWPAEADRAAACAAPGGADAGSVDAPAVAAGPRSAVGAVRAAHRRGAGCGRRPMRCVESTPDGATDQAAAAGAPTAAHRHVLPDGGRGGNGLLRVLGADAAGGPRRRDRLPGQVPDVRRGGVGGDAPPRATRPRAGAALHAPPAGGGV